MREYLKRALERTGYAVDTADSGVSAMPMLEKNKYDLLLTDIKMPVMDGIALARSAANFYPALKILMMTGYADQRERADGLDEIVLDVVPKPFSLSEIRQHVDHALAA